MECLPTNIPQNIEVDISNLAIGDTLRLGNIIIDSQLTLVGDSEMLIASVVAPAKQEEEIVDAEGEDESGDIESTESDTEQADNNSTDNNESESE